VSRKSPIEEGPQSFSNKTGPKFRSRPKTRASKARRVPKLKESPDILEERSKKSSREGRARMPFTEKEDGTFVRRDFFSSDYKGKACWGSSRKRFWFGRGGGEKGFFRASYTYPKKRKKDD